jgi:hypothetical protein
MTASLRRSEARFFVCDEPTAVERKPFDLFSTYQRRQTENRISDFQSTLMELLKRAIVAMIGTNE